MKPNLTINISVVCFLAFFFNSCGQSVDFTQKKTIQLHPRHMINESGCGDALLLVDEYKAASFEPHTFWFPKERSVCEDEVSSVIIKLDTTAQLQNLYVYAEGSCEATIAYKAQEFVPQKVDLKGGWNVVNINQQSQYLRLQVSGSAKIGEVALEGVYTALVKKTISEAKRPTFNEFMGINAFVDDPLAALDVVQNVREYHESSWHQKDSTGYNFSPSFPGFEFELFYSNMARRQTVVVPVLQHSAYWLTSDKNTEVKPLAKGSATTSPASYRKHGEFVHAFVQNYNDKDIALPYLENWNEPEKWWHGNTAYMAPYEYAAMSSQDWDAHQDSKQVSMSKANPATQLVMAGLSDLKSDYVNALRYWCDQNRNGNIPWKVVNAHVYAQDLKAKKAISPEAFGLDRKVADFVDNARANMPQAQVWLSEFGYDRRGDSPQSVMPFDKYTADEVQAIWLLRSFLLLSSTGLDKAFQYMIRDTKGKGLYTSSGLYKLGTEKIELLESWYYLKTLRNALGTYHFVKKLPTSSSDIYVYEFQNSEGQKAYAVWAGVETTQTFKQQALSLALKHNAQLNIVTFDKSEKGLQKKVAYTQDFKLDITEKPQLILEATVTSKIYNKVKDEELILDKEASLLFDEQAAHDPLLYTQSKPTSLQEAKTTTVMFKKPLDLAYVCWFDDQGQSELSIEILVDSQWETAYKGQLSLYQKWKGVAVGKSCSGLRLVHSGNTSKIGELVLYK